MWTATFERYMAALLHLIDVAGVDHVCFGADFDGGGGPPGLGDVTALPRITERLKREGFGTGDPAQMSSGNLLRILRAAEAYSRRPKQVHAARKALDGVGAFLSGQYRPTITGEASTAGWSSRSGPCTIRLEP